MTGRRGGGHTKCNSKTALQKHCAKRALPKGSAKKAFEEALGVHNEMAWQKEQ